MSVQITYFVHSITTDNEAGLATGWQPGKLSAEGVRRAQNVAKILANKQFDAVISSDAQRAVVSARIFFGEKYAIATDARLREADYGDFTGQLARLFKHDMTKFIDSPFPGGESYLDVQSRMEDFLHDLRRDYATEHVALVGHQATQLSLEVILNGKTWPQAIAQDWRKAGKWQAGWEYLLQ